MQQRVLGRGAVMARRWHVRLMDAHKANEAAIGTATSAPYPPPLSFRVYKPIGHYARPEHWRLAPLSSPFQSNVYPLLFLPWKAELVLSRILARPP